MRGDDSRAGNASPVSTVARRRARNRPIRTATTHSSAISACREVNATSMGAQLSEPDDCEPSALPEFFVQPAHWSGGENASIRIKVVADRQSGHLRAASFRASTGSFHAVQNAVPKPWSVSRRKPGNPASS